MITKIRESVLHLIKQHKNNEVVRISNHHSAGIYMIYVDCFEDNKIIPFYIGQTNNFQQRHKQHLTELMSLNRLNQECYRYALTKNLYDGKAKTCKIFTYMVNHHCTMNDWHMIILDEISDPEKRLQKEKEYIDSLYAPFFGFNQLNTVLDGIAQHFGSISEEQFTATVTNDLKLLLQLSQFGFSLYNWYCVCDTMSKYLPEDIVLDECLVRIASAKTELKKNKLELIQMNGFYSFGAEDSMWRSCVRTIRNYFSQHNLTSKEMQRLVVKAWLFEREVDVKKLEKYFARTKLKTSSELYTLLQQKHGKKITAIKDELNFIYEHFSTVEKKTAELSLLVMQQLMPIEYVSHPLGSLVFLDPIPQSQFKENECFINVEFTSFKPDYEHDFYPEICRIDYRVYRNGKTYAQKAWINNSLSDFFNQNNVYYLEQGRHAGPYNPFLVGNVGTHIPIAMEYRNGINEYSFKNVSSKDAGSIILEINKLIDDTTNIVYTSSGYKSAILQVLKSPKLKNTILSKKLHKLCEN